MVQGSFRALGAKVSGLFRVSHFGVWAFVFFGFGFEGFAVLGLSAFLA